MVFIKNLFYGALLCTAFAACSNDTAEQPAATDMQTNAKNPSAKPVTAPSALPSFNLQDASGNTVNLQNFAGKKLLVNLWASWCPPCRAEMPSIEKLAQSVNKENVAFVLLSLDDNFDAAKTFAREQNLQLPVYYPADRLPVLFDVQSIPTTFIFDENGQILRRIEGATHFDSDAFRQLLQ